MTVSSIAWISVFISNSLDSAMSQECRWFMQNVSKFRPSAAARLATSSARHCCLWFIGVAGQAPPRDYWLNSEAFSSSSSVLPRKSMSGTIACGLNVIRWWNTLTSAVCNCSAKYVTLSDSPRKCFV